MERFTGMNRCLRASISFTFTALLAVFLFFPTPASAKRLINRGIITVNDEIILESDVEKFRKKLDSKSYQELFGGVDPKVLQNKDAVLQLIVEEKIINQQVKKLDLQANDQEVDGQIRSILKRYGITQKQLEERLKQLNTTISDYRDVIRRQIERKNLIEREIRPSLEVSDEQLRHFFLRTARPSESDLQYKIAHILIDNKPKGGMSASERSKKVYEEVSKHPEQFDAYVKDYSDDSGSVNAGGVLGFFSASSLAKEFRSVVPKTEVGKVTAPIKTSVGYHIVKVLETRSDDFASLPKEKKEALRNQFIAEEMEKRMALWLERKKGEAYIHKATEKSNGDQSQSKNL